MRFDKWLKRLSLKNKDLHYKLILIFGLFFLFPVLGFVLICIRYNITNDNYVLTFLLGFMVFSLFGFMMLRRLFDEITSISKNISKNVVEKLPGERPRADTDELHSLVQSFSAIENQFGNTFRQLEKKTSEISILKELSELCYVTFDPEEILYVTLERSLLLTNSDVGSILILEKPDSRSFIVKVSIGLGELVKIGDRIDFETSIAKYAVINKSPLVVEDIEKDTRFGRANRLHYATKSFVCLPIKTSKDIVGVLTLSRKDRDRTFTHEDVEILTPLLSNAAFTYENLRLLKQTEHGAQHLKLINKVFKIINSSFRDSELMHAVLNEIQEVVPFDHAILLARDNRPGYLTILDLFANESTSISQGSNYPCEQGSIIDKALKQEASLIVDDTGALSNEVDQELLASQGCKSCLLAPLKTDGVTKGIIALTAQKPGIFCDVQDLIEWMTKGLSLAIERNSLSAALAKRDQELDTIKQIGSALASSTFDISQVLKYTMDMIRVIMKVEAGSLLLLDETKDELEFAVAFDDVESLKKFRLKLGQGFAGYVASRGESVIVNDVQKSPHFFSYVDEYTGFKTRSALCVPMISQGKVIGVLEVLNKTNGDFGCKDEDLLQSIASSVSIAIENARLYKETVSMAKHERDIRRMFQKFVPKEIVDRIIHDSETGKEVVEELKTLTLLNIDIRGFSGLSREIGPQKTVSLLNRFFSVMGGIVFKHHGIVDKYLGDGFLAIFGAPVSNTMDADNAVSAALEMKQSLAAENERLINELGVSLETGISIHTGEVVVGNFGFDRKMDYTVIGDSVNDVFKLQEHTRDYPNGVLITEYTRRATRTRPEIRETSNAGIKKEFGDLKIYELLGLN